ncbi:hypothetical protein ABKN59_011716 [Abortiporus biennis]
MQQDTPSCLNMEITSSISRDQESSIFELFLRFWKLELERLSKSKHHGHSNAIQSQQCVPPFIPPFQLFANGILPTCIWELQNHKNYVNKPATQREISLKVEDNVLVARARHRSSKNCSSMKVYMMKRPDKETRLDNEMGIYCLPFNEVLPTQDDFNTMFT